MTTDQAICDQVVSALRGITRALDLHYKLLLREYGLSGPQVVVLKAVHKMERSPISEIARAVHLSHATVTAIIDRLGRKGLVTRVQNQEDRREVFTRLTSEGLVTVQRSPALLHERFIAEFTGLERWEQNQILASLQRVATMIGASDHSVPMLSVAPVAGENTSGRSRRRRQTVNKGQR